MNFATKRIKTRRDCRPARYARPGHPPHHPQRKPSRRQSVMPHQRIRAHRAIVTSRFNSVSSIGPTRLPAAAASTTSCAYSRVPHQCSNSRAHKKKPLDLGEARLIGVVEREINSAQPCARRFFCQQSSDFRCLSAPAQRLRYRWHVCERRWSRRTPPPPAPAYRPAPDCIRRTRARRRAPQCAASRWDPFARMLRITPTSSLSAVAASARIVLLSKSNSASSR